MSSSAERVHGKNPSIGRSYAIDYLNAVEGAMDLEESNPSYKDDKEVYRFIDYLYGNLKSSQPGIDYNQISLKPRLHGLGSIKSVRGYFGIVAAQIFPEVQDLRGDDKKVIVPASTPYRF